jgi:hypothetical protein
MDKAHFRVSGGMSRSHVLLHDIDDVSRRERVEVQ